MDLSNYSYKKQVFFILYQAIRFVGIYIRGLGRGLLQAMSILHHCMDVGALHDDCGCVVNSLKSMKFSLNVLLCNRRHQY